VSETRYRIQEVLPHAERLVALLAPGCTQIAIAGSLRRGKHDVKDIEIVAAPRALRQPPAFGSRKAPPPNALEAALAALERDGVVTRQVDPHPWRWGERYKKLALLEHGRKLPFLVDLFIVLAPAQWGPIFAIRTGPSDFNQALMAQLLPRRGLKQVDGHLETPSGQALQTPTEEAYFAALGLPFIPPQRRGAWVVHRMLGEVARYREPAAPDVPAPAQQNLF